LLIRIKGPPGNLSSVGAGLQVISSGRRSPWREIHAGSGYWSQDSAVQVIALPDGETSSRLMVRWPGGKSITVDIPPGSHEIEVDMTGAVKVVR
jgi:enediyne biosynthesis protein E4